MKDSELNIVQRITLELLWQGARLFALMPYWFKYYVVENMLFFLLFYCLRYRMEVVRENLRNSFPEKSERERDVIRRRYYFTLAEVFVDTIDMARMNDAKVHQVIVVKDVEAHRKAVQGKDWIAMAAHHGCWEYYSYWGGYESTQILVAVYHPLRNKVMECLYQRLRSYKNAMTVPMKDSLLFYLRHREKGVDGKNMVMGLISDQNPPLRPDSYWFRFLNQDTIFFDGGEKLAMRCHLPVYFGKMERLRRGRYQMTFDLIYDGQEPVEPNEITERYVRKLEAMIQERPELWMWSHRRWKRKRPHVES